MQHKAQQLRIIAGKWRSRRIFFHAIANLRPTADRIRETLFNWLAKDIIEARCLDLFAGSGALGFEALSRGAQSVTMIDSSLIAGKMLQANAELLGADVITVLTTILPSGLSMLRGQTFDIVFLDPPFHKDLLSPCCNMLEKQGLLAANAIIYLEAERSLKGLALPSNWHITHSKATGQVGYHLARRNC